MDSFNRCNGQLNVALFPRARDGLKVNTVVSLPCFFLSFREEKFRTEAERVRKELESAEEKQRMATEMKVS